MNWPGITAALGLLVVAAYTMPWGIGILLFMAWVWRRS